MAEIVFILEPDTGRVTIESSNADPQTAKEISQILGQGINLNCARPNSEIENASVKALAEKFENILTNDSIYLYQIYHCSIVDGPGRRSVIQVAGCSIRCPGCYVPQTHERTNGKLTLIRQIVEEVEAKRTEHDGVTILGGEPFDQAEGLEILVEELKVKGYHLVIYSGYTLEDLLARKSENINRILAKIDLLIDGAFVRELARNAGEYRGSSNQSLITYPLLKEKMGG